jgi:peptidoglycan/xylan/chitin deacetylase (PgdA/CDA1 family)
MALATTSASTLARPAPACLTISLDFELFWGVKDKRSLADYGANLLGVRAAIPAMLALFARYGVRATWASVGMLGFATKAELMRQLPAVRPAYHDQGLNPYLRLNEVGADEASDPYHFGYSLLRRIADTPGMEIASHTFSHFYCLEPGADGDAFRADMQASRDSFARIGLAPTSLVFPRNQYDDASLAIAADCGIRVFRGNPRHSFYATAAQSSEGRAKRLGRLADSYLNLSGHHVARRDAREGALANLAASRFLRPYSARLAGLDAVRLARICGSMSAAAAQGGAYHLWWHPHNFGSNLAANLAFLGHVLKHFALLRERHGMTSETMAGAHARGTVSA